MALGAIMIEVTSDVIGVCRPIEIRRMALVAICILQLVVPVDVTRLTLDSSVGSGQWKPCGAVIEGGTLPVRRRMTL